VVKLKSSLTASELLSLLLDIENQLGRVRKERWGPRTIDLDIIFYGDDLIDEVDLQVPHPECDKRLFVLEPLCEIAPEWFHPRLDRSISQLLHQHQLKHSEEVAGRIVALPPKIALNEVNDGIFYRYSQS